MRIVIVEDEAKIREGLVQLIERNTCHRVAGSARNGREGLEMVNRLRPDLLITDIRMPDMTGLEMLAELNKQGNQQQSVILSGYSEFEYAQQAIRLGVNDYLLKPLTAEDITNLLESIDQRLKEQRQQWLMGLGAIAHDVLEQGSPPTAELLELLFPDSHFTCVAFMGQLLNAQAASKEEFQQRLNGLRGKQDPLTAVAFSYRDAQEIGCLITSRLTFEGTVALFQREVAGKTTLALGRVAWCARPVGSASELKGIAQQLRADLLYSISLGTKDIITPERIQAYPEEDFQWPEQLAHQLRKAVYSGNGEKVALEAQAFIDWIAKGNYAPNAILQGMQEGARIITDAAREFDQSVYKRIHASGAVEALRKAITFDELSIRFKQIVEVIQNPVEKREDIRSYVIMKAIGYIRENYSKGINLEEVAHFLDITPEYLSALFNREVKVNFSSFIKQYRISRAKQLLRGSNKKIYEVAQEVGFSDVKYFTRVFREEIGISPKEFRQMQT